MSNKNLNDFFDEEYNKQQEEQRVFQESLYQQQKNQDPYGFEEQKRQQMYNNAKVYTGNGQDKFLARKSRGKKALLVSLIAIGMVLVFFLGYFSFLFLNPDIKFINDVLGLVNNNALVWQEDEDKYQRDYAFQAAKAMLESIDQYSTLLTPEEYYELLYPTQLETQSNGLEYRQDGKKYIVATVSVGSSAYNKGVFAGDVVQGFSIKNNNAGLDDGFYAVSENTTVADFKKYINSQILDITVLREGKTVVVSGITKGEYNSTNIEYYFGADNTNMSQPYIDRVKDKIVGKVGYIRVTDFMDPRCIDDDQTYDVDGYIDIAMQKFKASGKTKLVLDLNYNTGGRDDVTAAIAKYFLHDKTNPSATKLVVSVDKDKNNNIVKKSSVESVYSQYFDVNATKPQIAVLTNGMSASASEMLTGALLDYQTAVQVGTTTYGKGIAQGVIPLQNAKANVNGQVVDSCFAAYMTYLKFYTPKSDVCKHGVGFAPTEENTKEIFADQLDRAIELIA